MCYKVPDIDAAIKDLVAKKSYLISGPAPAVAFEMRPIAWLRTSPGMLIELVQDHSGSAVAVVGEGGNPSATMS